MKIDLTGKALAKPIDTIRVEKLQLTDVKIVDVKYFDNIHTWDQYEMPAEEAAKNQKDIKSYVFVMSTGEAVSFFLNNDEPCFVSLCHTNIKSALATYNYSIHLSTGEAAKFAKAMGPDIETHVLKMYEVLKKKELKQFMAKFGFMVK